MRSTNDDRRCGTTVMRVRWSTARTSSHQRVSSLPVPLRLGPVCARTTHHRPIVDSAESVRPAGGATTTGTIVGPLHRRTVRHRHRNAKTGQRRSGHTVAARRFDGWPPTGPSNNQWPGCEWFDKTGQQFVLEKRNETGFVTAHLFRCLSYLRCPVIQS